MGGGEAAEFANVRFFGLVGAMEGGDCLTDGWGGGLFGGDGHCVLMMDVEGVGDVPV